MSEKQADNKAPVTPATAPVAPTGTEPEDKRHRTSPEAVLDALLAQALEVKDADTANEFLNSRERDAKYISNLREKVKSITAKLGAIDAARNEIVKKYL